MLQLLHEVRGKMHRIRQLEERAFGVGAGNDGVGADFFAGGEKHAGGCAVFHADLNDFGCGANLDAGHRLGALDGVLDGAHRPVDVGDDPLAETAARDDAGPEDGDAVGGVDLGHDGAHLRGTDIQTDDDLALRR